MMVFHYKQRNIKHLVPKLKINNIYIEKVKSFNLLGITIDENMTYKKHKQKVASKLAQTIGTMKRLKNFLPTYVMKILYNSLITSHLSYGILLWGKDIKRLNKLQKWAVRTMVNGKYNQHTDPIFKKHNIIKIADIRKVAIIKFHHKYLNNELPSYFEGFFETNPVNHRYPTRNKNNRKAIPSTVSASQSPAYFIPKEIDSIDEAIKSKMSTHSLQSVAKTAKKLFISKYNDTCSIVNCYICNIT